MNGKFLGALLTLLACHFLAAITLTAASPAASLSERDDDLESPQLWGRAANATHPGKLLGSKCTEDAECYSRVCLDSVCSRQFNHEPCYVSAHCRSRNCVNSTCSPEGLLYGSCTPSNPYYTYLGESVCSTGYECIEFACLKNDGRSCKADKACASGLCINGKCGRIARPPNSNCDVDNDCISGSCRGIYLEYCTASNGTFTSCTDNTDGQDHKCGRYPIGHACDNNGECNQGLCKAGKCTAGIAGDSCVEDYQCSGGSSAAAGICGSNGKCTVPKQGSVSGGGACTADAQCVTRSCLPSDAAHIGEPRTCGTLNPGDSGCSTWHDCRDSLCIKGTCQLGPDGQHCQTNSQCQNVCGANGICATFADNSLPNGPCKQSSTCISRSCSYGDNTRPSIDDQSQQVTVTELGFCDSSTVGFGCNPDSGCISGACLNRTCTYIPDGSKCTADHECTYNTCAPTTTSSSSKVCGLGAGGNSCYFDDQCFSQSCIRNPCPEGNCPSFCADVPNGGTCRIDKDCGDTCGPNKKCGVVDGKACSSNQDCFSKNCVASICKAAVKTTKSASSTKSSSRTSSTTSKAASSTIKSTTQSTTKSTTKTASA